MLEQSLPGQQRRHLRILEHEGQALLGVVRVERHVRAAGLEDAEEPHHEVERALDAEPHPALRPDAEPPQVVRQPVGARVQLA